MKYRVLLLLIVLTAFSFTFINPDDEKELRKKLDDETSKYTSIGNFGLTITNYGTYGHGFTRWPEQPSAEYPLGSGIEHLFDGGLWIGGFTSDDSTGSNRQGPFVTTGAVDASSVSSRGGGFEYTNAPGSGIVERSSLLSSRYYDPEAVSHQDFVMDYTDTNKVFLSGEIIENHDPLGVVVHHESYAWNFPFADFFVIMNYTIKNVSDKYIDSIYVGLWTDAVVRNTKVSSPRGTSGFYTKGGNGYKDSLKIAYEYDAVGDIGLTDSYLGVQILGSTPSLDSIKVSLQDTLPASNFVSWQFRNTDNPLFFAPRDDIERYNKLRGFFGGNARYGKGINPAQLRIPSNRSILISGGSFHTLPPGDSINVVFAVLAAKKFGNDPAELDTEEQKQNLYSNAEWALRAYHGEDRNRNNILDAGEDLDGNGKITRYILPSPPSIPTIKVVPGNQKAVIYWDKKSENSVDPISGKRDFEGYRLYRTQAGFDLTQLQNISASLVLMAEFDSMGNDKGFNSGFSHVELNEPVTFEGDTTKYYYEYKIDNLLNGWQYLFSVTAFDEGDEENNLVSLESSPLAGFQRILPGTPASDNEDLQIGVYPNPYYGSAIWDGSSERLRKINFFNLPPECEITIYTLSGDVIKRLDHNRQSNGSDLRWYENFASDGKQQMSGGEHSWDLITDNDQAIATGLYLFTVKNNRTGHIKTGKFLIVK